MYKKEHGNKEHIVRGGGNTGERGGGIERGGEGRGEEMGRLSEEERIEDDIARFEEEEVEGEEENGAKGKSGDKKD